jgi:hypothetical protein
MDPCWAGAATMTSVTTTAIVLMCLVIALGRR